MERGIPFYTLDEMGRPIALFDDGTVEPLPLEGVTHAGIGFAGGARPAAQPVLLQPVAGTPRLPRGDAALRGGGATGGGAVPHYAGLTTEPIPPPGSDGVGAESRGGGGFGGHPPDPPSTGGGSLDIRSRIASARARLQGAFGGGDSGYSGGGYGGGSGVPRPARPDRLRGRYAKGLDPIQAGGLTLHPQAMLPRVFPGLTPADPLYGRLASLPVGAWATILGRGTPQSIANATGQMYERAGTRGAIPATDRLLRSLQRGRGIEEMFQGVKAGPGDYESFAQPGFVYGQEPLPMGEAAYTYSGLLDSALSQEPFLTAAKYGVESGGWGSYLVDKWASKAMKKAPGKSKPIFRSVGRRLFR